MFMFIMFIDPCNFQNYCFLFKLLRFYSATDSSTRSYGTKLNTEPVEQQQTKYKLKVIDLSSQRQDRPCSVIIEHF